MEDKGKEKVKEEDRGRHADGNCFGECPVCFEPYSPDIEDKSLCGLACGHSLCRGCSRAIFEEGSKECPICTHAMREPAVINFQVRDTMELLADYDFGSGEEEKDEELTLEEEEDVKERVELSVVKRVSNSYYHSLKRHLVAGGINAVKDIGVSVGTSLAVITGGSLSRFTLLSTLNVATTASLLSSLAGPAATVGAAVILCSMEIGFYWYKWHSGEIAGITFFEEIATAVTANVLCVAGTAGGTALGAFVGSFAPGLGTVIGACVGAFVGGIFGYLLGRFGGKYCINALLHRICPGWMRAAQEEEIYKRALSAYCLTKNSSRSQVVSKRNELVKKFHGDHEPSAQDTDKFMAAMVNFEMIKGYREKRQMWREETK